MTMRTAACRGLGLVALWFSTFVVAAEFTPSVPQVRLPMMARAPSIDGTIEEGEWRDAARMVGLTIHPTARLAGGYASFWCGCDGQRLFIAMVSETAPGGALLSRVRPAPENGNARVWVDDNIEILLDPLPEANDARRRIYQLAANAKGAIWDTSYLTSGGGENWRGDWEIRSGVHGDRWHVEIALPIASMKVSAADLTQAFGLRIVRNWRRAAEGRVTEWTGRGGAFKDPGTMPRLHWDPAAPVVQVTRLKNPEKPAVDLRLTVRNPHGQPLPARARVHVRPTSSAPSQLDQSLALAPGATEDLALARPYDANELLTTSIEVTSPDGEKVYYLRDFQWKLARPEPFWETETEGSRLAGFNWAYYPSHNLFTALLDVGRMPEKAKIRGLSLRLYAPALSPLRKQRVELKLPEPEGHTTRIRWELPDLREYAGTGTSDEYTVKLTFVGTKADPLEARFVRHAFEWEGNSLGKSNAILPPYTPIEVSGNKLSTVLRQHTLNGLGLWDQVTSMGRPLLAAPMRLEAAAGGELERVQALGVAGKDAYPTDVVEAAAHRVVQRGRWRSASATGQVNCEWDYDGFMWWRLDLAATGKTIDALRVVIPVHDELVTLMHACGDGLRFNYAGVIPTGTGRVWDSSKAARNSIIGDYAPYIWVGSEERGICVAGENDAGWVTAGKGPCQELVRHGASLDLVLNLIDAPVTLDTPRTIQFGIMATPAKPMPSDWRRWCGWGSWRIPDADRHFTVSQFFLGSTICWGGQKYCIETRPKDGDLRIWDAFGRMRRAGRMDYGFLSNWARSYRVDLDDAEERAKRRKELLRNVVHGARNMVNAGTVPNRQVIFYLNARGVRLDGAQGQTFLDEWHREAWSKRGGRGYISGCAYDLNPVASFRDYAIWHYDRLLRSGSCDNLYWDDIFLQSSFDVVAGEEAYVRPDGHIQPAAGLRNMRALIRRAAILQHELGKRPVNVVHMTNTHIVPICSFAQMNYAWEDKSDGRDYQDRWPRDYVQAESIGRQSGNYPLTLGLLREKDPAKREWIARTAAGVCLAYGIGSSGGFKPYWDSLRRLLEFGYGRPEVTVSQHWEPGHPIRVPSANTGSRDTRSASRGPRP